MVSSLGTNNGRSEMLQFVAHVLRYGQSSPVDPLAHGSRHTVQCLSQLLVPFGSVMSRCISAT